MAMLRLARRNRTTELLQMVVSMHSPEALYYADEVGRLNTTVVCTVSRPTSTAGAGAALDRRHSATRSSGYDGVCLWYAAVRRCRNEGARGRRGGSGDTAIACRYRMNVTASRGHW